MFDLQSLKTLARIPSAEDTDAIIYDPPSNRVFTFNGDAHSSTSLIRSQARRSLSCRSAGSRSTARLPVTGRSGVLAVSDYQASQSRGDRADRRRRGRGGVRSSGGGRIRDSGRRRVNGNPSGQRRHVSRRPDARNPHRVAQHGPRPNDAPDLRRGGDIRRAASGRTRPSRRCTGNIQAPRRRATIARANAPSR
jgi:hypothetical protein